MADVRVKIGGRDFRLTCDDGQEQRVLALAEAFSARVSQVRLEQSNVGESEALAIAALAILDEYDEAQQRWAGMTPEGESAEWAADKLNSASARLAKVLPTKP